MQTAAGYSPLAANATVGPIAVGDRVAKHERITPYSWTCGCARGENPVQIVLLGAYCFRKIPLTV